MYQICLVLFSIAVKVLNSRFFLKILHRKKILVCSIVSFGTMIILIICYETSWYTFAFILSLIASFGGGFSQSLGEMTMIGMTKGINSYCVSGFAAGTGFSGVFVILAQKVLDSLKEKFGGWVRFNLTKF